MKIILASTSENRRQLLERMGIGFEVMAPDYEEIIDGDTDPVEQTKVFALGKAQSVWNLIKDTERKVLVLGFDSMIGFQGGSLGKPKDKAEAFTMLKSFIGQKQDIVTGMAAVGRFAGQEFQEVIHESTNVKFRADITDSEIKKFLEFGDWQGKCGGYSILGTGIWFLEYVDGDFQNVVGVPVMRLGEVIRKVTECSPIEALDKGCVAD